MNKTYIGSILVVVAGIIFWVFDMPAYDYVSNSRPAIQLRNDQLASRTKIIDNINNINKEYAKRSAEISRFSFIVPAKKSTAEIVSMSEALASQNGLQLSSLTLGSEQQNQNNTLFNTQPISMSLSGTYPAFRSFLNALEKNVRITDIYSINAAPEQSGSANLLFDIKANAYYLK